MRRAIPILLLAACERPAEPAPRPAAPSATQPVARAAPSASTSAAATASVVLPTAFDSPHRSLDAIGKAFIAALVANEDSALNALEPKPLEYAGLLYPEFVKSGEPLIGSLGLQWAWDNLANASRKDRPKVLAAYGAKKLVFERIKTTPVARGAVTLHEKPIVEASLDGKLTEIGGILSIVERDGRFRVLRYTNPRR